MSFAINDRGDRIDDLEDDGDIEPEFCQCGEPRSYRCPHGFCKNCFDCLECEIADRAVEGS